ncbi:hypothetical protein HH212_24815 [Massilia forsythiae]|uniref:Putative Flp pilus-assembly TadG-like N-terminal domain-containing protein n=1 Tax=Massilia forsythiae TaxID=2728020 RepID=A0A7Z2ZW56_9BURK|nr:pilus assembly protein TadG-related protein [Massilia forsythiae]QJE02832.1 hypothetical protein HH212_24815 [Massilia forsythiae]
MIFTLLFAAASALVCLVLYNSGQLANSKTQLQNAADAGAYSGALLLARDHNFSAYTNRAMVANQVSVAQLVSLKSYTEDAAATHKRMGNAAHTFTANVVPSFKPFWTIAKAEPVEALAAAYAAVAPTAVKLLDELIRLFEQAQELHHDTTALDVTLVANEVVKQNDDKAGISLMSFQTAYTADQLRNWKAYSARHSAVALTQVADRFANVVVNRESTDELIRDRGSVLVASWESIPTSVACPPPAIPVFTLYGFAHDGGTLLSANKKRWLALDATQGAGFVACETPVGIPFGYPLLQDGAGGSGGGLAGSRGGYGTRIGFNGNPRETRNYGGAMTGLMAIPARSRYSRGPGTSLDAATGGLQDYYRDIANPLAAGGAPANQSAALNGGALPFTIEVRHDAVDIRTSTRVMGSGARTIRSDPEMKGDTMRTLASGSAYFYRSNIDTGFTKAGWARSDRKTEMANLFNPYWQAQLVENPASAVIASMGAP